MAKRLAHDRQIDKTPTNDRIVQPSKKISLWLHSIFKMTRPCTKVWTTRKNCIMLQYTNSRRTAFRFKANSSDWQPESKNENEGEEKERREKHDCNNWTNNKTRELSKHKRNHLRQKERAQPITAAKKLQVKLPFHSLSILFVGLTASKSTVSQLGVTLQCDCKAVSRFAYY